MSTQHIKTLKTERFLEKIAALIDTPEIKTFQWSEDGKCVLVYSRHYAEELCCYKEFSMLKKFKTVAALHGFLCTNGFKKMAWNSSAEVQVFQHPQLSITGAATLSSQQKSSAKSALSGSQHKETLKKHKRKELQTEVLFLHPAKKTTARSLYQYINYIHPGLQSRPAHGVPFNSAEASPFPDTDPEYSGSTSTLK